MPINPDFFAPRSDISEYVNNLVEQGLQEQHKKERPRTYLGGSWVGDECARRVMLKWASPQSRYIDGRVLRIFEAGHDGEKRGAAWLRAAGFDLRTEDENGQQFGFSKYGGSFKGSEDGIVMGGPEGFRYPFTWGHKTANASKFSLFKRVGVRAASPTYYGQTQIYMRNLKITLDGQLLDLTQNPSLFTIENKDTSHIYAEQVHYNRVVADDLDARAKTLLTTLPYGEEHTPAMLAKAEEQFPKISDNHRFMTCAMCQFAWKCHGPTPLESILKVSSHDRIAQIRARAIESSETFED